MSAHQLLRGPAGGELALVAHAQIVGPVVPVEVALVRERRAVEGRVVGADDRARAAGRAVARRRELVDVERPPAALGQLERRAGADDAGADDPYGGNRTRSSFAPLESEHVQHRGGLDLLQPLGAVD